MIIKKQFNKRKAEEERKWLKDYLEKELKLGKRILFASFAFSRTQQLVTDIYKWFHNEEWFKDYPVVLDGLLMNEINSTYSSILNDEDKKLFDEVMEWKNIKKIKDFKASQFMLGQKLQGIYFASSGFCEAGRIQEYLPAFIPNSKCDIILTGYCGSNVGNQLADYNCELVKITDKEVYVKNADIHQLHTYSSHISHDELLKLWCGMKCDKILVHHSDDKSKQEFVNEAKDYMMNKGVTTRINYVDDKNYQFTL